MSSDHFEDDDNELPLNEGSRQDPPTSYEVGYGKPPKDTQFKPGQSGNRKGRPKKVWRSNIFAEHLLDPKLTITENGRIKKINIIEAMMRSLGIKIAKGDRFAIKSMIELAPVLLALTGEADEAKLQQEMLAALTDDQLRELEMIVQDGTEKALAKRHAKK